MVDPTEGYNRMKAKLIRNVHGSKHVTVSLQSQSAHSSDNETPQTPTRPLKVGEQAAMALQER